MRLLPLMRDRRRPSHGQALVGPILPPNRGRVQAVRARLRAKIRPSRPITRRVRRRAPAPSAAPGRWPSTSAASSSRGSAVESAAKEGVLFGARSPACDVDRAGCADPGNVEWHVRNEAPGVDLTVGRGVPPRRCAGRPGELRGQRHLPRDDRIHLQPRHAASCPASSAAGSTSVPRRTPSSSAMRSASGDPLPEESTDPGPTVGPPGECLVPNLIGLKSEQRRRARGSDEDSPARSPRAEAATSRSQARASSPAHGGRARRASRSARARSRPARRRPPLQPPHARHQPLRPRRLRRPDAGRHADAHAGTADVPPRPDPRGLHRQRRSSEVDGGRLHRPFSPSSGSTNKTVIHPDHEPAVDPG